MEKVNLKNEDNNANTLLSAVVKTHIVIDIIYNDAVYAGTKTECEDWKSQQGFGYRVVPMTKDELLTHNC